MKAKVLIAAFIFMVAIIMSCNEGENTSDNIIGGILMVFSGLYIVSAFTAVVACVNNIGPGLGMVGPIGNFSQFSALSKIVLSLDMLLGRLELYPMLILALPGTWKRR